MSTKAERARAKAEAARKEAERLEAEALKDERMLTAGKVPTCPECGGRSFKIGAYTTVYQSIQFVEDADDKSTHEDCDWGDDYESGDHTDISESAECNDCGTDVQEMLERFGWTFYAEPQPLAKAATATEDELCDCGAKIGHIEACEFRTSTKESLTNPITGLEHERKADGSYETGDEAKARTIPAGSRYHDNPADE